MPEPDKPKTDPSTPLTDSELLTMRAHHKANPAVVRVIDEALKRRLESEEAQRGKT